MTQTATPPPSSPTAVAQPRPVPSGRGVNWRMGVIVAVFALLVGFPVYTFVKAQMNGGVERVANGGYAVDLKALGYFPFDDKKGTIADVPQKFRDLDGKTVTLEGFCYQPNTGAGNVTEFQFVYNVNKCCYSGPPQVQERVFAFVPGSGTSVPDQSVMVRLTGTLHVNVRRDPSTGNVDSVYTLDVKDGRPVS